MINYLLLVVLPNIRWLLCTLSIIGSIWGFLLVMDSRPDSERAGCIMIAISLFVLMIAMFIPKKSEVIQLKLISVAQEIKGLDGIAQKSVDKLNKLLDS